jgi:signal transduction histidine kinase
LITSLSSILGFWLAGKVIFPVTQLAQQVSEIGNDFSLLDLKGRYPVDEVGKLAQAFDIYQHRLGDFIERERAFTSDVSHELRTPLTVIDGASEVLLSNKSLNESQRNGVQRIARASVQITRLASALLTLAREKPVNSEYQCSVNKILTTVVNEHLYLLKHKPVEVDLTISSDEFISSDSTLLSVVLSNLIRNAFSYTNKGTVQIQLIGNRVIIIDTGEGMDEDQLLKMFIRHYSNKRAKGGHGIGLSLVKRICLYYGWEISVASQKNQGTQIELLLNQSP